MITNKLFRDLVAYFEAKENPTQEEKDFLAEIKPYDDAFPVSFVTRTDLEDEGFDGDKITDDQMDRVADDMGDCFGENLYRDAMRNAADYIGLPEKCRLIKVDWDADGADENADLPSEVEVPIRVDDDDVSDWLSNYYGYCVNSWEE